MTSTTSTKAHPDLDVADYKLRAILRQIRGLDISEGAEGAADIAQELHQWAHDYVFPDKDLTFDGPDGWHAQYDILYLIAPLAVRALPLIDEIRPISLDFEEEIIAEAVEACWKHYRTAIEGAPAGQS